MSDQADKIQGELKEPRQIAEGILMYPESKQVTAEQIIEETKDGYVVEIAGQRFVLCITSG